MRWRLNFFTQVTITIKEKIDYLKRIYYVLHNGIGYACEEESARARLRIEDSPSTNKYNIHI